MSTGDVIWINVGVSPLLVINVVYIPHHRSDNSNVSEQIKQEETLKCVEYTSKIDLRYLYVISLE